MAESEKDYLLTKNAENGQSTLSVTRPFSAKSQRSFKQLVRILGPALKVHLGIVRQAKKEKSSNHSANNLASLAAPLDLEFKYLEEKMNIDHLHELMTRFETHFAEEIALDQGHVLSRDATRSSRRMKKTYGLMDLEQFQSALAEMINNTTVDPKAAAMLNEQAELLFRKIDRSHEGLISWDNFCTYIIMRFQEQDLSDSNKEIPFITKPRIIRIPSVKETISKIMIDHNPTRYLTVSKEGIIGVWATNLELIRSIEISNSIEDDTIGARRRTKLWITDAICMKNVHKLAIASTNRDISFFDMSTPSYKALFHLCALPQVPMCLEYVYDRKNKSAKSMLLFGTDRGDIHILTFHLPMKGLFEKPFKKTDSVWRIIFSDLSQHSRLVSHSVLPMVHSDWVRRMKYIPVSDMLISCSNSSKESLVMRCLDDKKRKTYIFKVMKGIDCFDYSKEKSIIATGGVDHIVRLWDSYVTLKPVAILKGHQASVLDVCIHEGLNQVFSYSKDGCLKSWDIKEHSCIQNIAIRIPFNSLSVDYGSFPFFLAPCTLNSLIICVGDCLAELKLGVSAYLKRNNNTHSRPLCSALYNPSYKQIITGSEGSEIIVWDVETGKKLLHLKDAHGGEELSCMALDGLGQRLITGARDGTAIIWNLTTGLEDKRLEPYEEAEITGIIAFPDREQILTVGWSRKLLMYNDSNEGGVVGADPNWTVLESHSDDILSVSYYPPNFVATSSFDGAIYIWSLEREKIFRKLKNGKESLFKKKVTALGFVDDDKEPQPPVDNVLFLTSRSYQESAVLVSTQAGIIEFWPIFGVSKPTASFFAASTPDGTIMSVATDDCNKYLISGDSKGEVVVWDIERYCNMKTFREVVNQVLDRQHANLIPQTIEDPPAKICKWKAHTAGVVSVQFVPNENGPFIVSGSVDGSVKLWSLLGALVGMLGQKTFWNLACSSTYQSPAIVRPRKRRDPKVKSAYKPIRDTKEILEQKRPLNETNKLEMNTDTVSEAPVVVAEEKRPHSTSALPDIRSKSPGEGVETVTKDAQIWTNTDYYRSRTMVLDEVSKKSDVWSILGENYNESFRRRMSDRRSRRSNFSKIDDKLVSEGAIGANVCSPFKALYTPDAEDFQLPKGLPVTPRMKNKGIDPYNSNFADQIYVPNTTAVPKFPSELLLPVIKMRSNRTSSL